MLGEQGKVQIQHGRKLLEEEKNLLLVKKKRYSAGLRFSEGDARCYYET